MKPRLLALRSKRTPVTSRSSTSTGSGEASSITITSNAPLRVRMHALEARERDQRLAVHRHDDRHPRMFHGGELQRVHRRFLRVGRRGRGDEAASPREARAHASRERANALVADDRRREHRLLRKAAHADPRERACARAGAWHGAPRCEAARSCATPREPSSSRMRVRALTTSISRCPACACISPACICMVTTARWDSSRSAASCSRSPCALSRTVRYSSSFALTVATRRFSSARASVCPHSTPALNSWGSDNGGASTSPSPRYQWRSSSAGRSVRSRAGGCATGARYSDR